MATSPEFRLGLPLSHSTNLRSRAVRYRNFEITLIVLPPYSPEAFDHLSHFYTASHRSATITVVRRPGTSPHICIVAQHVGTIIARGLASSNATKRRQPQCSWSTSVNQNPHHGSLGEAGAFLLPERRTRTLIGLRVRTQSLVVMLCDDDLTRPRLSKKRYRCGCTNV